MKVTILILLLASPAIVFAACPNACSGHGSCGEKDMCTCHTNWEGGDCSERVCPFNWAWVTTSNGDLNFDGDRWDGTEYDSDHRIEQSSTDAHVITQRSSGGAWENWPYFSKPDEGHFYMECSNRGLCNRQTGQCECFPGYTGQACRRSVCPSITAEECSGHGTCETVQEMTKLAFSNKDYQLWDRDMQRTCLCDPGYWGPACDERLCPYGDDPLTTGQSTETQWVDVSADAAFAGHFRLLYTDYFGETWTSSWILTKNYDATDGDDSTYAGYVETALQDLPNSALYNPNKPSHVSVSLGYCDAPTNTMLDLNTDGFPSIAETNMEMHCSGNTQICMTTDGGTNWFNVEDGTTSCTITANDNSKCFFGVAISTCIRYKIEFHDMPGALNLLSADTGRVTVSGKTNYQDDQGQTSTVGNTLVLSTASGYAHTTTNTIRIFKKGDQVLTCASNVGNSYSGSVFTCNADPTNSESGNDATNFLDSFLGTFGSGEMVHIQCGTKSLGYYTVDASSSSSTASAVLELDEAFPTSCDPATDDVVFTSHDTVFEIEGDVTDYVGTGDKIKFSSFGPSPEISFCLYENSVTRCVFSSTMKDSSPYYTTMQDTSSNVLVSGEGTSESSECSDRGICDRDTGICTCFKGYSGDACDYQNSMKL